MSYKLSAALWDEMRCLNQSKGKRNVTEYAFSGVHINKTRLDLKGEKLFKV